MSAKYLLPCASCGEKIPVEVAQAGQEIECKCGAGVSVPTMAGIRALQRAEPSPGPQSPPSRWEARHGVLLVGVVFTCAALCVTAWFYHVARPRMAEIEEMHPLGVWMEWQYLREGVRRPSFEPHPFQAALEHHRRWMVVGLGTVAVGMIIMLSSACIPKRRLRRRIVRVPVKEPQTPPGEPPRDGPDN